MLKKEVLVKFILHFFEMLTGEQKVLNAFYSPVFS